MTGLEQHAEDRLFERRLKAAYDRFVRAAALLGPTECLFMDGGCDDARGEEGDGGAVEQGEVSRVVVSEVHKKRGSRTHLSHTQAFAAPTKNKDTDNPREHICTDCAVWSNQMYMQHMDVLLHPLLCSSKLRSLSMKEDRN